MLYRRLIHCNSHYKYGSCAKWNTSVIKVGVAYVNEHVSRHLKEELPWAIDKVSGY